MRTAAQREVLDKYPAGVYSEAVTSSPDKRSDNGDSSDAFAVSPMSAAAVHV